MKQFEPDPRSIGWGPKYYSGNDHHELFEKVRNIIAHGLAGYEKILNMDPKETHVPPTFDEVKRRYQHNQFFKNAVDHMVGAIMNEID